MNNRLKIIPSAPRFCKQKPSAILDKSRELYDEIRVELEEEDGAYASADVSADVDADFDAGADIDVDDSSAE